MTNDDFLDLRQQRLVQFRTNLAQQLDAHLAEAIRRAGADPRETHRFRVQNSAAALVDTYLVDGKPVLKVGPPRREGDNVTVPFEHLLPACK